MRLNEAQAMNALAVQASSTSVSLSDSSQDEGRHAAQTAEKNPHLSQPYFVSATVKLVKILDSDPSNKICADCRTPLLSDRSRIHTSFYHADPPGGSYHNSRWTRLSDANALGRSAAAVAAMYDGSGECKEDSGSMNGSVAGEDDSSGARGGGSSGSVGSAFSSEQEWDSSSSKDGGKSPLAESSGEGASSGHTDSPGDGNGLKTDVLTSKGTGTATDIDRGSGSGAAEALSVADQGKQLRNRKRGSAGSMASAKTVKIGNRRKEKPQKKEKKEKEGDDPTKNCSKQIELLEGSGKRLSSNRGSSQQFLSGKLKFGNFLEAHVALTPQSTSQLASGRPELPVKGRAKIVDGLELRSGVGDRRSDEERRLSLEERAIHRAKLGASHGVFVCALCAAAHRSLGAHVTTVKSLANAAQSFTSEDVAAMESAGGNARARNTLERYVGLDWAARRPHRGSSREEREVFARAKYELLAFAFPPRGGGGLLDRSPWSGALRKDAAEAIASDSSIFSGVVAAEAAGQNVVRVEATSGQSTLPSRLVDYFCVVGPSGRLEGNVAFGGGRIETTTLTEVSELLSTDPEAIRLDPKVLHCYPGQAAHSDATLPSHLPKFVFPDGCRPSVAERPPKFFSFVLTLESGMRLYGAAMQLYDEAVSSQDFLHRLGDAAVADEKASKLSGQDGGNDPDKEGSNLDVEASIPDIMHNMSLSSSSSSYPELLLLPKCLVILSHYAFHDSFRAYLLQLYRVSLAEAPLPIERYIAHFVREVPLPPRGRVEVKLTLTDDDTISISRPPRNRLPLVGFSYRPLFTSLSVSNIMVVVGCLLQETKVAICSRHVAMLAPASEALISLLFPFVWQGCYIPVMPYSMLDVLDAPVPLLVGLHSRYLAENRAQYRPRGVVFVDLDDDVVHLGFEDSSAAEGEGDGVEYGRPTPQLPEREASKLKSSLEEHGGVAYLSTSSGRKGRITYGNGEDMENYLREAYAQETAVVWSSTSAGAGKRQHQQQALSGLVRSSVLSKVDRAYPGDEHLLPIKSFVTDRGTILRTDIVKKDSKKRMNKLGRKRSKGDDDLDTSTRGKQLNNKSLLDRAADESHGFSATQVRNAFLRFFVSIFRSYEKFVKTLDADEVFAKDEFLKRSEHLNESCREFIKAMLSSQMFQRFVEEKLLKPDQHEIRFFDESIVAKKNRSTKSTLRSGGKKRETPFLSDDSDAIREIFAPPPPSNRGLPDDGGVYHYGSFPKLDLKLFGKTRTPEQWDQDLMQRFVAQPSLFQHKLFSNLFVSTPSSDTPERDVVWALHFMAYKSSQSDMNTVSGTVTKSEEEVNTSLAMIPVALGFLTSARRKQNRLLSLLTKAQALYRMLLVRGRYQRLRTATIYLQNQIHKVILRRKYGRGMTRLFVYAREMQRTYRGYRDRSIARRIGLSVVTIQRMTRGWLVRCYLEDLKEWAITVQAMARGRRIRFAYKLVLDLLAKAQGFLRGWLTRNAVAKLIENRIADYRDQIFELWRRACTPLSYRSKFWKHANRSGFLYLAIHEEELIKLWKELGLKDLETKIDPETSQRTGGLLGRKSCAVYDRFLVVKKKLNKVRNDETNQIVPVFPCEIAAIKHSMNRKFNPGSRKEAMLVAYRQLSVERAELYEKLKFSTDVSTMRQFSNSFGIPHSAKKKKELVIQLLWEHKRYIEPSCTVILINDDRFRTKYKQSKRARRIFGVGSEIINPISKVIDEQSTKSVQSKIETRVNSDIITTLRSCVVSMQLLLEKADARHDATRHGRQRDAICAGMIGESWFVKRAFIMGEFLSCGEEIPYYCFAKRRLGERVKYWDGRKGRLKQSSSKDGRYNRHTVGLKKDKSNEASGQYLQGNGGISSEQEKTSEFNGRNKDEDILNKNSSNVSKRSNFIVSPQLDSFDKLLMETSMRNELSISGNDV